MHTVWCSPCSAPALHALNFGLLSVCPYTLRAAFWTFLRLHLHSPRIGFGRFSVLLVLSSHWALDFLSFARTLYTRGFGLSSVSHIHFRQGGLFFFSPFFACTLRTGFWTFLCLHLHSPRIGFGRFSVLLVLSSHWALDFLSFVRTLYTRGFGLSSVSHVHFRQGGLLFFCFSPFFACTLRTGFWTFPSLACALYARGFGPCSVLRLHSTCRVLDFSLPHLHYPRIRFWTFPVLLVLSPHWALTFSLSHARSTLEVLDFPRFHTLLNARSLHCLCFASTLHALGLVFLGFTCTLYAQGSGLFSVSPVHSSHRVSDFSRFCMHTLRTGLWIFLGFACTLFAQGFGFLFIFSVWHVHSSHRVLVFSSVFMCTLRSGFWTFLGFHVYSMLRVWTFFGFHVYSTLRVWTFFGFHVYSTLRVWTLLCFASSYCVQGFRLSRLYMCTLRTGYRLFSVCMCTLRTRSWSFLGFTYVHYTR